MSCAFRFLLRRPSLWASLLALSVFCSSISAQEIEADPAQIPAEHVSPEHSEELSVWQPANRITPEEAVNLIWAVFLIVALAFVLFSVLLVLLRDKPTPSRSDSVTTKEKDRQQYPTLDEL